MPKKDDLKTRIITLIIILLLIGSTLTYGILSIFGSKNQQAFYIPQERILNYELSQDQIDFLISRYFTIIKYEYPSNCFNCLEIKKTLEDLTQNSDNQIFLQEIETNVSNQKIYIHNILNETTIEYPDVNKTISSVCNSLIISTTWSMLNQI